MASIYLLEVYLYTKVTDATPHLDTPIPGSRFCKSVDHGREGKLSYQDTSLSTEDGCLVVVTDSFCTVICDS